MKKKILLLAILMFIGIVQVNAAELPTSSYIIGKHILTRGENDNYGGRLTTPIIMQAAKSIESDNVDDMKIYYVTAAGNVINGLTGEAISVFSDEYDELEDNIEAAKYYNLQEIPQISIDVYDTNIVALNTKFETANDDIPLRFDIYGAEDWNGVILEEGITSDDPEHDLVLLEEGVNGGYTGETVETGHNYSYVIKPYISDGENKFYLNVDYQNQSETVYAGPTITSEIINNKMVVGLDGLEADYTITGATLYAKRSTNKSENHITPKDLLPLLKDDDEASELLVDDTFIELFKTLTTEQKYDHPSGSEDNYYYLDIADVYMDLGSDEDIHSITLGDLGNSEKESNDYWVELEVAIDGVERPVRFSGNAVSGVVYQDELMTDPEAEITSLNLFYYTIFIYGFANSFTDGD